MVQIVYLLPFLLFSGYSGYLADVISKRTVLVGVKGFEIAAMALGAFAIITGHLQLMLVVLFMMGLHSTVFSPAKYGIVPEILPDRDLSRGNAILEMTTLMGIVLGGATGVFVFASWKGETGKMALIPMAIAVAGFLASLRITRVPPSGASQPFRVNPYSEVVEGTRHLLADRPLWLAVLGVAFFWSLGALLKPDLLLFGGEVMHVSALRAGLLLPFLSIGIGVGNMLAGRLSGDKVELGLVPLGSTFMGLFAIVLFAAKGSYTLSVIALMLLGATSGLFIVPLYAYMQQRSGEQEKGRVVATNNFYQTIGMLIASGLIWGLHDQLGVGAGTLLWAAGIATLLVTAYILTVVPDYFIRFVLWLLTHTVFRIHIVGQDNVPFRGPALLVSNHMSHVDGFVIGACVQRFIRFMVWKPYYDLKALNWFFRKTMAIPVGTDNRRDVIESIRTARKTLEAGHIVCIFAEGAISRTGNMLPFKRGMEKIVEKLDVPIIPVHIDRLWGSIFSFEKGKFFWKWPKHLPYPVTVSFGAPLPSNTPAHEVRQAIQELSSDATAHRKTTHDLLDRRVIRNARRNWNRFAMADSTGRELTYGRMLTGSVLISSWMRRHPGGWGDGGVLLPPTVAGALVNIGATMAGCAPVNLNFTAGKEGHGIGHGAVPDPHRDHVEGLPCQSQDRSHQRHGVDRRHFGARWKAGSNPRLAGRAISPGKLVERVRPGQWLARRLARHRDLLERQHGRPQRRDALALQRDRQHRSHRPAFLDRRPGPHCRGLAVLPLLRVHRDHLVPADRRLRRGLPSESYRRQSDRRPGCEIQSHTAALDPHLLLHLHPQVHRGTVGQLAVRAGGGGETARADSGGFPRKVRPRINGRLRLHRDVAQ